MIKKLASILRQILEDLSVVSRSKARPKDCSNAEESVIMRR